MIVAMMIMTLVNGDELMMIIMVMIMMIIIDMKLMMTMMTCSEIVVVFKLESALLFVSLAEEQVQFVCDEHNLFLV